MLAYELKKYLEQIPDNTNILIYVTKTNDIRQLIFSDLDKEHSGHLIIDAEYEPPVKSTSINKEH